MACFMRNCYALFGTHLRRQEVHIHEVLDAARPLQIYPKGSSDTAVRAIGGQQVAAAHCVVLALHL